MDREKRKFERTQLNEAIEMVIEEVVGIRSVYNNVSIFIEEVSHSGMRFRSNLNLGVGEEIEFNLPSMGVRSMAKGRISWKKQLKADCFIYGLYVE